MSWNFDDQLIHKQLIVGCNEQKCIGWGNAALQGSIGASGCVNIGGEGFSMGESTLMVETSKKQTGDRALTVKGNATIEGTGQILRIADTSWVDASGEAYFQAGTGGKTLSARFSSADARPKPFDIDHPSQDGWRLRYACIEGPEVGVYCRGRLRNKTEITLPDYWKDLVHTDSISVQLQSIGAHQDIIVKRWDKDKIYLQSNGGMPIDCFYHVYAERKDINPLIVEYEGETCKDYPDPNHHTIPDVDRNYNDERYRGDRNTITG